MKFLLSIKIFAHQVIASVNSWLIGLPIILFKAVQPTVQWPYCHCPCTPAVKLAFLLLDKFNPLSGMPCCHHGDWLHVHCTGIFTVTLALIRSAVCTRLPQAQTDG